MSDLQRRDGASRPAAAGVVCRRLWPSDREAVRAHFLRLDPETRANRFMAAVGDRMAEAYAERALVTRGMMFGAFTDGILRGVGELRPTGALRSLFLGPQAEAAFVVERAFRRDGLGSRLFQRVVGAARARGVRDLQVRCLNGNGAMRRLALKHGADLRPTGPETEGAIHLDRATPFSLMTEGISEALDLALALTAPDARPAPRPI